MNIKHTFILILTFLTVSCQSQTNEIEDKTIDYYFGQIAELEIDELINQKILIDSLTITPKYKDSISNGLNQDGFMKYADIKANIYMSFFKDYLYQQKVEYNNDYYILYFTMAGFDDMQWDIIKMPKDSWNGFYNGIRVLSNDYWFCVTVTNKENFSSPFNGGNGWTWITAERDLKKEAKEKRKKERKKKKQRE